MTILLESIMKKNKIWLFIGVILSIPILLNILLMIEWFPVIQAGTTPALWLSFWGSYIGSIISALIAFYVLYINRKDQFATLSYELERKSIEDNLSYAVNYISIYSKNDITQVYNIWKLTNDKVSCRERLKVLLDSAFYHYESFMIRFPTNRLSSELFFLRQQEKYKKYVTLLLDLQVLFNLDNTHWNTAKAIKETVDEDCCVSKDFISVLSECAEGDNVFNKLLERNNISQKEVEREVRTFFDEERDKLQKKLEKAQQ